MKIYIIYRMYNCAIPQAISLSREEAEKFMDILTRHDPYAVNYWIEEKIITNGVTEI